MNLSFFRYFLTYVFRSKTRQRLLALAIFGLFISSFSLLVLQGVMGGLQKGVISRSKEINSHGYLDTKLLDKEDIQFIENQLKDNEVEYLKEYEVELLVKSKNRIRPVILHGVERNGFLPDFLKDKDLNGVILGADLASSLKVYFDDDLVLISPSHSDFVVVEIPRRASAKFSEILVSNQEQVDKSHGWVDIKFVQNLTRKIEINKMKFFSKSDYQKAKDLFEKSLDLKFIDWEKENSSLVWALKLETSVMILLFVAMSLLVAICITSGFMIFYDKIKTDLISFWILGLSKNNVLNLLLVFTQVISILFVLVGLIIGEVVLLIIDSKSLSIVPDIFVEQNIPITVSMTSVLISFFVPYIISSIFSFYSFKVFKGENSSFLKLIRSVS